MASISSTNSLGNTSLRGYGGMASGIDRDSIIEKMTLGTTTKISNQKSKITQLQWKQEAYRNISDQILDFGDKYTSFSSTDTLKDPTFFAKSIVSVHGKDEATRFVTATGSSDLISNVSLKGVEQLATSTVRQSDSHISKGIEMNVDDLNDIWRSSKLQGSQLIFEKAGANGSVSDRVTLTLPDGYTESGSDEVKKIDYTGDPAELVRQLNLSLGDADITIGDTKIGEVFKFEYDTNSDTINLKVLKEDTGYQLRGGSTALSALGYDTSGDDDYLIDFKQATLDGKREAGKTFEDTGIYRRTALQGMTGAKLTFNYDGSQKEIELITKEEAAALENLSDEDEQKKQIVANLQARLNKAFGTDAIKAGFDEETGKLNFTTTNKTSSVSIVSNDYSLLNNLGIAYGESNKVNLSGKLSQDSILGDANPVDDFVNDNGALDLKINGVAIEGLTKDSSISDILSKINSTTAAGVKATYVDATGQFMLVSSETGKGREITLDSNLSKVLFGAGVERDENGAIKKTQDKDGNNVVVYDEDEGIQDGQNAVICVSYGNGVDIRMERASNSFNLEGLNVTVSGTFGGKFVEEIKDGKTVAKWEADSAGGVTFTAKADVDAIVERVKGFFEDFNKLATDINNEITTRPDSSYGPLTDEQKAEMDDTSIENWEKKAKQGMLYGDSAMRDLSMDVQGIFLKLMNNVGFDKLKEMGITYSDDYGDGGTISFDETKFRTAVENDSEAVGNIFTGGGGVSKGLVDIMDETFTPYATRYASKNGNGGKGSYGRLIEIAGSEKKPTTLLNNQIYNEIEDIQDLIERLQEQLKTEQDRYISQFTTMETLLNQMNTQSSYLSQLTG